MEQSAPWDEIARLYREGEAAISAIERQFGLSKGTLSRRARKLGWARPKAAKPKASQPETDKAPAQVAKTIKPLGLVKRIYNTIDKELTKLEEQRGASSQDRERASRALSQMVSSLEKAVEMQREMTKESGRKASGTDKEALKDAEDLRRDIAERIERLRKQRRTGA